MWYKYNIIYIYIYGFPVFSTNPKNAEIKVECQVKEMQWKDVFTIYPNILLANIGFGIGHPAVNCPGHARKHVTEDPRVKTEGLLRLLHSGNLT